MGVAKAYALFHNDGLLRISLLKLDNEKNVVKQLVWGGSCTVQPREWVN